MLQQSTALQYCHIYCATHNEPSKIVSPQVFPVDLALGVLTLQANDYILMFQKDVLPLLQKG